MIKAMLIAGAGGFVGTCGRYLVGKWCAGMFHGPFPMGTFLVNIIGCFIIGLFFGLLEKAHVMTPEKTFCSSPDSAAVSRRSHRLPTTCGFSAAAANGQHSPFISPPVSFSECSLCGQAARLSADQNQIFNYGGQGTSPGLCCVYMAAGRFFEHRAM